MRLAPVVGAVLAAGWLGASAAGAAAPIKVCSVRSMGGIPGFIAKDKGFFAAQGLDADIVMFDSAQPIAVAVASGDCDFGVTGMTAAFFNMAGQGALTIIGAGAWEHRGFQSVGMVASNQAYAAGLHSFKDLGGRSIAITQLGTPLQFFAVEVARLYHIDESSLKFLPLQSNGTVASAIAGNQADSAVQTVAPISALLGKGDAKLLGWMNDVLPERMGEAVFTATKTANERLAEVKSFMTALRASETYLHDAFASPDGQRRDGSTASEVLAIAGKYLDQPESALRIGVSYYDPQSLISLKDIAAPMDWYKAQHMLKGDIKAKDVVDLRYAIEAPKEGQTGG